MLETKDVLVIGLGRFGSAIVRKLLDLKQRVTVVDVNEHQVNRFASIVEYAKVCDTREEAVLRQLGVNNYDHVVIAIGSSIEASIITTLLLKDMGVNNITVKAKNDQHQAALQKLGIPSNNIIMPEREMGEKTAQTIAIPIVADYVNLLGNKFSIIELFPRKTVLSGHSLAEINIKSKYNVNICAIRRGDELIIPNGETIITEQDSLIVIGEGKYLEKFERLIN
ncbi:MAG: TrkA family potassium uptake protein [Bacilli bacterium]|jgi:trk system potassium uptake protein TrkA|nr:TrkA family potassium uptake protein [Bacilli bacterium]